MCVSSGCGFPSIKVINNLMAIVECLICSKLIEFYWTPTQSITTYTFDYMVQQNIQTFTNYGVDRCAVINIPVPIPSKFINVVYVWVCLCMSGGTWRNVRKFASLPVSIIISSLQSITQLINPKTTAKISRN